MMRATRLRGAKVDGPPTGDDRHRESMRPVIALRLAAICLRTRCRALACTISKTRSSCPLQASAASKDSGQTVQVDRHGNLKRMDRGSHAQRLEI
jgi:hypothetical protein